MGKPPDSDGIDDTTWLLRDVLRGYVAANVTMAGQLSLSPTDLGAMEHLMESDDLGPVELGHRMGMRSASATALVDRLEQAGHVQRTNHPTDRRRRTIVVTPQAVGTVMEVLGPLLQELVGAANGLGSKDRAVVNRYLASVAGALWAHANGEASAPD